MLVDRLAVRGAVGAAIGAKAGVSAGSESLDGLVRSIRSNLSGTAIEKAISDKTFRIGVKENVSAGLRGLVQRSPIIRRAIAKKELVAGHAIYSMKTGRVEFWDVGLGLDKLENVDKPVPEEPKVIEEVIPSDHPKQEKKKGTEKPAAH